MRGLQGLGFAKKAVIFVKRAHLELQPKVSGLGLRAQDCLGGGGGGRNMSDLLVRILCEAMLATCFVGHLLKFSGASETQRTHLSPPIVGIV